MSISNISQSVKINGHFFQNFPNPELSSSFLPYLPYLPWHFVAGTLAPHDVPNSPQRRRLRRLCSWVAPWLHLTGRVDHVAFGTVLRRAQARTQASYYTNKTTIIYIYMCVNTVSIYYIYIYLYMYYVCVYMCICFIWFCMHAWHGMAWHGMVWHGVALMCACVYVCLCRCACVPVCACMYVYIWLCIYIYIHYYMYIRNININIYIYMIICAYIYIYIYVYTWIHIYIYIFNDIYMYCLGHDGTSWCMTV